jgi:RNA polymerase sigma factor (sigma-70 family)
LEGFPPTRPSLLVRLRSRDDGLAWKEFSELYSPLVYRFARRNELQDADAADLMQEVFQKLARELTKFSYEPARGAFRSWLFTLVRHETINFKKRKARAKTHHEKWVAETNAEQEPVVAPDEEDTWNHEWHQQLLHWSMQKVRDEFGPSTWTAFIRTAIEGKPVDEVSRELGMTSGSVYVAKSRILKRLKEEIQQIDGHEPLDNILGS